MAPMIIGFLGVSVFMGKHVVCGPFAKQILVEDAVDAGGVS